MKKLLSLVLAFIVAFGFSTMAFADVAPPAPEYPMLDFPELIGYSGTYYVSNPEGAAVYGGSEVLPTGEVIPHAEEIEVYAGYRLNKNVFLAGIYKQMPVIVFAGDVTDEKVYPIGFNKGFAEVFEDESVSIRYKEAYELSPMIADATFVSSNEDVVTVDANGVVTATGEGTAYVKGVDPATGDYDIIVVEVTYTWWQTLIRVLLLGFLWY